MGCEGCMSWQGKSMIKKEEVLGKKKRYQEMKWEVMKEEPQAYKGEKIGSI